MKQEFTITVYTENQIGLLNRIAIMFSRRKRMNDLGKCFLTYTTFTGDQYCEISIGNLHSHLQRIIKGR